MSSDWSSSTVVSRREFVRSAAAAGAYGFASSPAVAATRSGRHADVRTQVAVFGGGVGGLTVAHELAERGFRVMVFEPKAPGGKARSIPVPGTARGGRQDLPG